MFTTMITTLLVQIACSGGAAPEADADPFEGLAFLIGSFEGKGEHSFGAYDETITCERALSGAALVLRSHSTMGGQTVFQDVRVFTYDAAEKMLMARQFTATGVVTYEVELGERVVLREVDREGASSDPWSYTLSRTDEGFSYVVHVHKGGSRSEYVKNSVRRRAAEGPLASLAWLAGRWAKEGDGQYLEEIWSEPHADCMVAAFRWIKGDRAWIYELMSVEKDAGGIVFRLRHFNRGLVPWKSEASGPLTYPMVSSKEREVVFENSERDSPRRFVYRRDGDVLTIRIEGPDGSGDEFKLTRVKP